VTIYRKITLFQRNIRRLLNEVLRMTLLLFVMQSSGLVFGQITASSQEKIDSLIVQLSVTEEGPKKSDFLLEIAKIYITNDCKKSIEYGELSLNLAKKVDYQEGIMNGYDIAGDNTLMCENNYIKSMYFYNKSLELANELNNEDVKLHLLIKIAFSQFKLERYEVAIDFLSQAKEIAGKLDDQVSMIGIYAFMGEIYLNQGENELGFEAIEKIIERETDNGIENLSAEILFVISRYYQLKGEFLPALSYAEIGLDKNKAINNNRRIAYGYSRLGNVYLEFGNFQAAIDNGLEGLKYTNKSEQVIEVMENTRLLAMAYDSIQDYKNANLYLKSFYELKESISKKLFSEQSTEFETEFKLIEQERKNENAQNVLKTKELENKNNSLVIRFSIIALIAVLLILFFIFLRLRNSNKLNKKLESQQFELKKLSIVAANIDQMVLIVDQNNRIEWVNNAFEKKFGYLKFEAIDRMPFDLLSGDKTSQDKIDASKHKVFEEKISFESIHVQYTKDKTPYTVRLHFTPILNIDGGLERYIIISHDITEEQKVAEELKELSLVANNTTNSIVIFNHDRKVLWVNDSFTKISGSSLEAVKGKGPLDIYNGPLFSEEEKQKFTHLFDSKEVFTIETQSSNRITNLNYWISMSVTPVFDNEGNLEKYVSVSTDITDIKRLEEQYEGLVEGSSDMIYEIDIHGIFIFINDVMSKTTGFSKEQLTSIHFLELVRNDYKEKVAQFYSNQIKTMDATSYLEFPAITRDQKEIWVGQVAKMKVDESGKRAIGFSVITRDITDKKKAENALTRAYDNSSLLSDIGMQITSTLSVMDIIQQVYGNINKLMDANIFGIGIPNKENTQLIFPEIIENGTPLFNVGFDLKDDKRLGVICFNDSKEIIIDDIIADIGNYVPDAETPVAPVAGDLSISLIYLPLILKGKTIGVITVQSFNAFAYDKYQVSLVRSLASFVAIAMENAGLYETMEEKIALRTKEVREQKEEIELNYLNTSLLSEMGQLISSTLNLDEILDKLYEMVGQLMEADIFAIVVSNEKENVLDYKYIYESNERIPAYSVSMDETNNYPVWCIKNRKEILINDNEVEYSNYIDEIKTIKGKTAASLIFYPMIVENKMIGALSIQSFKKNAYQSYHIDLLKTMASYIGTVIDNASLYDTLEYKVKVRTEELEQKNNDITASINYARRLQKGILPSDKFMHQLLPDSFVYYRPKDIVSGDFYWVDRTHSKILIAVVDCTGHGVPGAMMSIIGRNLLDQAVNEKRLTIPSQILNFLQVGLSVAFGQTEEGKADLFDGMDLALCSINMSTNTLEFAGANNSLYLIQDEEVIALKGDKVGITAEYEISNSYTNVEIEVKKGDVIYLTSDGLPDQFGGPNYKKFTYRRMQNLFLDIHKEDIPTQYERVKDTMKEWMDDKEQTDDICLMGIKI